ncbi:MAG: putative manganese-dependent inorganic diphosphatase [Bacilli bacterium]|nr:putative manganese-dependent inorganic diphosphatase [Bacilli bacterium]
MEKVYVFGHRRPDTDSVTAAITLSYLKNQLGVNAVPVVLSDINNETKYALDFFKVDTPKYLNDVKVKVKDLNYSKKYFITDKTSVYQGFLAMTTAKIHKIPVVDEAQHLVGILSMGDIAEDQLSNELHHLKASYDNILEVLNGTALTRFDEEIEGEAFVASYKSTTIIETIKIDRSSIVIMGDRHSVIEYAVNNKARLIILTGGSNIKPEHVEIAKANKVNIIKTDYDTFKVTRIFNLCKYASEIVSVKNVLCIQELDDVKEFISIANQTKYSYYPVINRDEKCLGMLRLSDANEVKRHKVILVDHNSYDQSVVGLEEADIMEIIDHHNIGTIGTSMPINFRNMPVGSTNTIIYQLYNENLIPIPKQMAGLMLSGILSDTLILKSPTTTDLDRTVVTELSNLIGIDYKEYGINMLKAGSSIKGKTPYEVLYTDFKIFPLGDRKMGIGQITTTNAEEILSNKDAYVDLLNQVSMENDYYFTALFITDIIENGSYILYSNEGASLLRSAYGLRTIQEGTYLPNIVSRKKQVVPNIMAQYEAK